LAENGGDDLGPSLRVAGGDAWNEQEAMQKVKHPREMKAFDRFDFGLVAQVFSTLYRTLFGNFDPANTVRQPQCVKSIFTSEES
jgi:hypothetical protein